MMNILKEIIISKESVIAIVLIFILSLPILVFVGKMIKELFLLIIHLGDKPFNKKQKVKSKKTVLEVKEKEKKEKRVLNEYLNMRRIVEEKEKEREYSKEFNLELAKKLELINDYNFKRPNKLEAKDEYNYENGIYDINYTKKMTEKVTIEELLTDKTIKKGYLDVYVESLNGNLATLVDDTGVLNAQISNREKICGEFILIEFERIDGENINFSKFCFNKTVL